MSGTLKVITVPEGASIAIDNANTNLNSPNEFILPAGIHYWSVYLPQYQRIDGNVTINDSEIHTLIIQLQAELSLQIIQLAKIGLVFSGIAILANFFKNK